MAKAQAGVAVRVVVEDPSSWSSAVNEIKNAGGSYGQSDAAVEVGSMNWTSNSLSNNRELGIILTDTGVENTIENQFSSDYSGGTAQ
ncbi:phosphatidylserine/phosphatidylglycerophosphate/cardiolipin synthase-like enzyme [Catenulispora sp. GAS73]|uniref:phospholipase D-like domain-containing protein n=1 Tax=Catenulispora sp. GAS73 TaxID=3156269 RepID=UPI003512C80D